MPISVLPSSVVNKIAAGEVIERPASVVKELVENAVDSGATRVDVAIERGGAELIRVVDNGCGMAADELPLAVTNHATSKIETADDLFRVGTLGFRGEALASIAEVSRFTLRSRQAGADSGAELLVHGGAAQPVEPAGCPVGTAVEVRQLFFNTPVRQKFLRTPQTEVGHCTEAFSRIALAHPGVHFALSHNGRVVHDLPATDDWRGRIAALFGEQIAASLIAVESTELPEGAAAADATGAANGPAAADRVDSAAAGDGGGAVRLSGFVANPTESRANNRLQYLLLNGRAIRDRSLQHALSEAYRGLLLSGRYPICFLRLDMPAGLVDVNVHPTKLEVRFAQAGRLYSQLLGTLRSKFLTSDLKPVEGAHASSPEDEVEAATGGAGRLVDWAKNELQQRIDLADGAPRPAPFRPFPDGPARQPLAMHRFTPAAEAQARGADESGLTDAAGFTGAAGFNGAPAAATPAGGSAVHGPATPPAATTARSGVPAIQLHTRYLVVQTDAGMEVIDQHALHERILYEQIREKVLAGAMESQKLLVPEPVELTPEEAAAAVGNRGLLGRLGVEVEPFGGDTVLVSSYPAMLANLPPAEVLRDLIEKLLAGGKQPEARDVLDDLLHSVSCKAAVKYGDRLTPEEIESLLADRHVTQNHHHCPHGRPTALLF
ncbi:MAG: DNA mismatch repair endonuclease MutL, partial [Planctomycetota bacterium]